MIILIGLVLLLAASLAACADKTDSAKLLTEVKTTQFFTEENGI